WSRVEAGRLWRASNWFYSPHLLVSDQELDLSHFVMPMREVAQLYQFGARILDDVLATAGPDRQVFIARPSTLHRRITNFSEIEMKLVSGPFEPRTEPYLDQSDYSIPINRLGTTIESWMGVA